MLGNLIKISESGTFSLVSWERTNKQFSRNGLSEIYFNSKSPKLYPRQSAIINLIIYYITTQSSPYTEF